MKIFQFQLIIILLYIIPFIICNKLIIGYFTDWTLSKYPITSIPFDKLTHINYAFGLFNEELLEIQISTNNILKELVKLAHQYNKKVLISIGGWTGSKWFSPILKQENKRRIFLKNIIKFLNEYELDGIDIDWEYPNRQGLEGNLINSEDSFNLLKFLKELKFELNSTNKLITAAVRVEPFDDKDSKPLKDVREFSFLLDWINIMAYDLNGNWSNWTGPVGGLDFELNKGAQQSIKQAINDWSLAGFPKDKMVIGVPFYGISEQVEQLMNNNNQYAKIVNGLPNLPYYELFNQKILLNEFQANDKAGWMRHFDNITNTPWLFNKFTKTFIAYDDIQSLKIKTDYLRCNGLKGVMLWALDNDYNNHLINALQNINNNNGCNYNNNYNNKECINNIRYCKNDNNTSLYYKCENNNWVLYKCPHSKSCSQFGKTIKCSYT